jgi:hypothetical protein
MGVFDKTDVLMRVSFLRIIRDTMVAGLDSSRRIAEHFVLVPVFALSALLRSSNHNNLLAKTHVSS